MNTPHSKNQSLSLHVSNTPNNITPSDFAKKLLAWHDKEGRKDLPWQQNISPYRVWISEIMLQQTQVTTVIPYYLRFMESFPNIHSLARASTDQVLHHWSGLGYYARARNLHKSAKLMVEQYDGEFPADFDQVIALPGIGRSTAGAILSIACNQRHPILDGNVKRVLTRYFAVEGWPGKKEIENTLWQYANELTPEDRVETYTQAIMDLGATLCTRSKPDCAHCPFNASCLAFYSGEPTKYPHKKPKKAKPTRSCTMVIIENSYGDILLEKRPPTGIWGGLMGLPEFDSEDDLLSWLVINGIATDSLKYLSVMRHTFSHFHLDIQPIHIKIDTISSKIMESTDWLWYKANESEVGLAAPIAKLLQQVT